MIGSPCSGEPLVASSINCFFEKYRLKALQTDLNETFVYVTHDQVEALSMGDRIAVLNEGKLQQVATPEEIYKLPENTFVANILGSPPMNLIPCNAN